MYCLFLQHLAVLGVLHPWRFGSSVYGEWAFCLVFMEFILMDRIKCWYNIPLQVLRAAPTLHSLIICGRLDVEDILEYLFHKHVDLRKLILEHCCLVVDSTGLLANIVALYPDLEVLSLESCSQLTSASYLLIQRLKKLSELNLSNCQVYYVCVKLLETHVCIREHM